MTINLCISVSELARSDRFKAEAYQRYAKNENNEQYVCEEIFTDKSKQIFHNMLLKIPEPDILLMVIIKNPRDNSISYLTIRKDQYDQLRILAKKTKLSFNELLLRIATSEGYVIKIDLAKTKTKDIPSLKAFTGLTTLDLSDNPIEDVSPLSNLSKLENLILDNTKVNSIKVFENLTNLKRASLQNTPACKNKKQLELIKQLKRKNPALVIDC
jgi:hypothetical protein